MNEINTAKPTESVSDISCIGHDAISVQDRRLALDACLNGQWLGTDISRLERVDTEDWKGWLMWRRPAPRGDSETAVVPPNPRPNRPPR